MTVSVSPVVGLACSFMIACSFNHINDGQSVIVGIPVLGGKRSY